MSRRDDAAARRRRQQQKQPEMPQRPRLDGEGEETASRRRGDDDDKEASPRTAGPAAHSETQALRALAWALAIASVGCFALMDGDIANQAPSRIVAQDQLTMVGGVLGLLWSGPLTILAGIQKHGSYRYRIYQPLQGGSVFVLMQAIGWTFYAISAGLCLVLTLNPEVTEGTLMVVGALGFCANAMLNSSLDWFKPKRESHIRKRINSLLGQRSTKGSAALLLSAAALVALCAMDTLVEETSSSRIVWVDFFLQSSIVIFVLCALLTHVFSGAVDMADKGYRLFQPFRGGIEFQVLQSIAWALLGTNVYSCVNQDSIEIVRLQGGPSLFGAFGFTANVLLVASIGHFHPVARPVDWFLRSDDADKSAGTASQRPEQGSPWVLYSSCVLSAVLMTRYLPLSPPLVGRLSLCGSALCATPLAHIGGWLKLSRTAGYRLFRPLHGPASHILAQAFGWILYGLVLYIIIVTRGESDGLFIPPALLAQSLILESVRQFANKPFYNTAASSTASSSSASDSDEDMSDARAYAPRIKLRIADGLALAAAMTSIALEVGDIDPWTWWAVHAGASCVWTLVRLGIYVITFEGDLSRWKPFEGPDLWILCEAISWTLFVVSALGSAVILSVPISHHAAGGPSLSLASAARGWIFATTVGYIFAHVLLRYGAVAHIDEEHKIASGRPRGSRRRSASMSILAAGSMPKSRGWSPWVVVLVAIADGLAFVWIDRTPWSERKSRHELQQAFIFAVSLGLAGALAVHLWVGPRTLTKYRFFQPFQGGSMFVLFQAISWTLFSVCLVFSLIAANAGLENVLAIPGTVSLLGAGFATSLLLMVWSLRFFTDLPKFSITIDGGVGLMLGLFSVSLFMFVDFAVIRFALPYNFVRPVIASAWVAACASVPLSGFVMMKSSVRKSGLYSPTLVVLGCALWSFTILLGALLVVNSVYNNRYIPAAWSATLAGATNLASHALLGLASVSTSSPRELLASVPVMWVTAVAVFIGIRVFAYLILPTIRAFLDYPMHVYGMIAKRWEGWLSPDGLQALRNVHVQRGIRYGPSPRHVIDVLRPLSMEQVHTKLAPGERLSPLVYLHGGGHLAVSSELLLHSMTPFTRAGMTVYAVEYPLSPDEQYPSAVLSVLYALLWIQEFHCGNPDCAYECVGVDPYSARLESHECHFSSCGYTPPALDFMALKPSGKARSCAHCGGRLGTTKVQLVGDSAGGSLVAMATALLCNENLYRDAVACASEQYTGFKELSPSSFPQVERLGVLYGLLGRQTPLRDEFEGSSEDSYLWKIICHVAILLVFRLYDSGLNTPARDTPGPRSSLTDIPPEDLQKFAPDTLLICGTSDPLYPCNVIANKFLNELGHPSRLFSVPGTHAFHGFPVNWMRYIGVDWTTNALPATYELLAFFTGGKFDKAALVAKQRRESMVTDYSPLIVFPLLLVGVPAVVLSFMLRHMYKMTETLGES